MKPRSKRQFRVCELSGKLPELSDKFQSWAFKNCIEHIGYRNKMWTHCLCCGHVWPTSSMRKKTEVCEGCGWKLKIETTRKQKLRDWARFAFLDVVEEFQVIRYFEINCHMKSKTKANPYVMEVMQHWILPDGNFEVISRLCGGMGMSYNHFHGPMSLKNRKELWKYNTSVYKIHPNSKVWPIYERNGFTAQVGNIRPFELLKYLPTEPKAETLIKTKQYNLLSRCIGDSNGRVYRHWPSIKIAIRSNYIVKDAVTWLDYLDLLDWFRKDLRNVKYVCPANLKKEHDRYVKKKNQIIKKQDFDRKKRQAEKDQIEYQRSKAVFFGLVFKENDLEVKVLEHIEEFIKESEALKHCVFTNRYFDKAESLILSARIKGKPIETVEVSLKSCEIIQSRGLQNKATTYNKQIVELVNRNMNEIRDRYKEIKTA